jgi:hypothetical protein
MAFEDLTYSLLGVKHYVLERYKGNVLISTKRLKIAGQQFYIDETRRMAYLIPPDARCWINGIRYRIMYDLNDACPLNDLGDVLNENVLEDCMDEIGIPKEKRKFLFWSKKYTKEEIATEKAKWKLCPPTPIERVGLRPEPFMEWLDSNTTGEILRKAPEKFAWLREVFMVALIALMVIGVVAFLTGSVKIGG